MLSHPVEVARSSTSYLTSLPSELVIEIICQLPSFSDIFALSATCHQIRHIWIFNVMLIYTRVASKSIACHSHARKFLVEKGGPALDSPMSAKDVIQMVRNSRVVEKAVQQVEREIVCRVAMGGHRASDYYRHPANLTRSERPRFIRSYYTLWGMMQSNDNSKWSSKLESMTLNQLYRLYEMSKLTQSIGQGEEPIPIPPIPPPRFPTDPIDSINNRRSEKRCALRNQIWEQIQNISERVFHPNANWGQHHAKHEGFLDFVLSWDTSQDTLGNAVTHGSITSVAPKPSPASEKQYIWDDSSDDENQPK